MSEWEMVFGIHNFYEIFNKNNSIFKAETYTIGENLEVTALLLKKYLEKKDIELATLDQYPIHKYSKIIFLDFVDSFFNSKKINIGVENYLIINECEIIKKDNWDIENHKYFKKIFTWNDKWVDNKKYFKFYWGNYIPENYKIPRSNKLKFCTLIAGNKFNNDKRELYSERIEAIKWFEKKHPDQFEFFGMGWGNGIYKRYIESLIGNRFFSKIIKHFPIRPLINRYCKVYFSSYRGIIKSKREILTHYKFSICYENARDIPGYITEKIFDCFLAGCVPIYLGAPNVRDFIPENTFIDKTRYNSYDELYDFLISMSEQEYSKYLDNIEIFLNSEKGRLFSVDNFAQTITNEMLKD